MAIFVLTYDFVSSFLRHEIALCGVRLRPVSMGTDKAIPIQAESNFEGNTVKTR